MSISSLLKRVSRLGRTLRWTIAVADLDRAVDGPRVGGAEAVADLDRAVVEGPSVGGADVVVGRDDDDGGGGISVVVVRFLTELLRFTDGLFVVSVQLGNGNWAAYFAQHVRE